MKGPKYTAMASALATVQLALQRTADVYGSLNSQDATYRGMQQEVGAALALPEDADPDTPPAPVVLAAMTADQLAEASAGIVSAIRADIEQSDVAVMSAIVQTGADTVAALKPAEQPAA